MLKVVFSFIAPLIVLVCAALLFGCIGSTTVAPPPSPTLFALPTPFATPSKVTATIQATSTASAVTTLVVSAVTPSTGTPPSVITPAATKTTTAIPANVSRILLKYQLIDKFGKIFYCDPDLHPVAREVGDDEIARRVAALRQNPQEYNVILQHLGLAGVTNPSPAQNRLIDAERKRLNSILLEPETGGFKFSLQTSEGTNRGMAIQGVISFEGAITVTQQQAFVPQCPICLTGSTRIDTPNGAVPIRELKQGMMVWTLARSGQRTLGAILDTVRRPVPPSSLVIHLVLDDGRNVFVSAAHPTVNGKRVGDLNVGDIYDGAQVVIANATPLGDSATYDFLPSGETGVYWANGIALGSTLAESFKASSK